ADQMGLKEIPTPAGGCKLAEKENSRRYWPVLTRLKEPTVEDFELSNIGRQYWFGDHWLSMGRNEADNSALERLVRPGDAILRVRDFPSPFRTCPPAHPVG
ncbi:MAG: tRNA(5-methylaminomethyl-2-thiouridylate) methyltransferase, partial [Bilophila wadsworthia]